MYFGISAIWIVAENKMSFSPLSGGLYFATSHDLGSKLVVNSSGVLMYPPEGKSRSLSDMTIYQCLFVSVLPLVFFFHTKLHEKSGSRFFAEETYLKPVREDDIPFPIVPIELFLPLEQIRKWSILGFMQVWMRPLGLNLGFLPRNFSPRHVSRNPSMACSKWLLLFLNISGYDFSWQVCSGSVCHGHALHLKARGLGSKVWGGWGGSPGMYFPMKWGARLGTPESSKSQGEKIKTKIPEAECRHYHRVDAVLRPVVFYQEKYCPSWEGNDTNHFKEVWHRKHVGLTGLPHVFFWTSTNFRSVIPKWAALERGCQGFKLLLFWSLHPFACNSCLSYVVASWTWCFFGMNYINIYIIGGIIQEHPGTKNTCLFLSFILSVSGLSTWDLCLPVFLKVITFPPRFLLLRDGPTKCLVDIF